MHHLGMELDAGDISLDHGAEGELAAFADDVEPGRNGFDMVAVAHPDVDLLRHSGEERSIAIDLDGGRSIFALVRADHLAAESCASSCMP